MSQQPPCLLIHAHNGTALDPSSSTQVEFPADSVFLREDNAQDTTPAEFASLQTNVYLFSETLFKQANQFQLQPPMLQQLLENESRELDDDDATDFFKTAGIQLNFIRGAAGVAQERANACAEFRFKQVVQQRALSVLLQNVTANMQLYESKYNETEKIATKQFAILGSEQLPNISQVLSSLSRATAYDGKPLLEQSGIDTQLLETDFNACLQAKETILKQLEYLRAFLSAGKARLSQDTQNVSNKKLLVDDWESLQSNIEEKLKLQFQILQTYEQNYALLVEKKKEEQSFECLGIIQELKSQNFIDRVKEIDNALRIDYFKCAEKKMSFDQDYITVVQNLYKLKKRIVLCIQPVEASAQKTMEYKAGISRLKLAAQLSTLYTKSINEAIRRKQFKQQLVNQVDRFSSMLKLMRDTENTARLSFDNEVRTSLDQEEVPYNILVPGLSATVPELVYQIPQFDEQLPSTIEPPEDFEDISEHDIKAPEPSSSQQSAPSSSVPDTNWNASQVIDLVSNHALSAIQQLPQVSQSSNLVKSVEEMKESLPEKVDEAEEVDSDAEVVVDEEKNGSNPQSAQAGALGESFSSVTQPPNEELQAEIANLQQQVATLQQHINELAVVNEQYQKRVGQLEFENEMKQSSLDGANQRIDELSLSLKALQLNAVSSTHQDTQLAVTNEQQANSFAETELEQVKLTLNATKLELETREKQLRELEEEHHLTSNQLQSQNQTLQEQIKTYQIERLSMEEHIMNLSQNLQHLEGGYVALQQANMQLEERVRSTENAASSSHGEIENYINAIRQRESEAADLHERLTKSEETVGKLRQVISTTIPRMQTVAVLDSCIKTADSFLPEVEQNISSMDRQSVDLVQAKFTNEQDKGKYVAITGQQIELIAKQIQQYFNVLEPYCEATGTTYAAVLKSLHVKTKELQTLASELTSFAPQQQPQPAPSNVRPSAPSAQPQPQPIPQPQPQPPKVPLSGSMYPGSAPTMPSMPTGMSSSMMGSAYKAPMPYKVSNHYAFGDKMLFVKTQQSNHDVWKAVTVQGTDFYLAPESVKALRMKIPQNTTSAIGSVVEVAISAPKQNPLLIQDWRGSQYFVVTAAFD